MHLFNKENIWSNPHASSIHPVIQNKYNNSVNRIISKEEKREDPRRDSSIYLRVQWCFNIPTRNTVFLHAIQQLQVILHTELILLQESPRNTTTTRLIPCRLLPATVPRVSRHSTRQNKASGPPTAFQGHTAQAGFQ